MSLVMLNGFAGLLGGEGQGRETGSTVMPGGQGDFPLLGGIKIVNEPAALLHLHPLNAALLQDLLCQLGASDPRRQGVLEFLPVNFLKSAASPHSDSEGDREYEQKDLHVEARLHEGERGASREPSGQKGVIGQRDQGFDRAYVAKGECIAVCASPILRRHMSMATEERDSNMAIFADFENVAIGADQAKYDNFDIGKVIERVLVKGNVVVRKAYCDWSRYERFKRSMHEANFELIDIPHVRQSGKNSADIRMVVDALDLCYTKPHIDTFVVISGDSDFSPLVSKLRENNKIVIGVGVKRSTSELFVANCDEFIFYDDLVRRKAPRKSKQAQKKAAKADAGAQKKDEAVELVLETLETILENKGGDDLVWGSMIKQAIKRRKPGFNESYFGFRGFNSLLEEARERGLLELQPDEKSGGYIVKAVE